MTSSTSHEQPSADCNEASWVLATHMIGGFFAIGNAFAVLLISVALFVFVGVAERPHHTQGYDFPEPISNLLFRVFCYLMLVPSLLIQFVTLAVGAKNRSDFFCVVSSVTFLLAIVAFIALTAHGIPR